jgi:hypothetical protein
MPAVMEWVVLALLVPAIVVPVVLLWGFSGCSLLFKPPSPSTKVFEAELTPGSPEFEPQRRCVVLRIEKPLRGGDTLGLTLRGSPVNRLRVERVTVSPAAGAPGDPYDSGGSDPPPVAESLWLPKDGTLVLEDIAFVIDPDRPLLVAFDLGLAFEFGARVRVVRPDGANIRSAPSGGSAVGTQPQGAEGIIVGGPQDGRWEVQFDEEVGGVKVDGWAREQDLGLAGDIYRKTGVPPAAARTFHAEGLEEAAVADRRPSVANPGGPYASLGSIYLVERIDAS